MEEFREINRKRSLTPEGGPIDKRQLITAKIQATHQLEAIPNIIKLTKHISRVSL